MTDTAATDDDVYGTDEDDYMDYPNCTIVGVEQVDRYLVYEVNDNGCICEVNEDEYRIVDQYEAARRRQAEALALAERRWRKPEPPPPPPEPEAIPPGGKLTRRQAAFCEQYAAQPVATRAAVLAGYAEDNASSYGSRLLKNPLVLDRIARLRADRAIHYVLDRDTLHDKIEAVFFEALGERRHAAAVAALRLQASLDGMLRASAARSEFAGRDDKARESQGQCAQKARKSPGGRARKARKSQAKARKARAK